MLYWPAIALARVVGVAPECTVAAFGFLSIAAGLGLAAAILGRAGLLASLGALGAAVALVAFAVLPGQSFDERDHLAAIYGLPFLAVSAARAARAPVDVRLALLAGLGAGVMAAIKPPYALVAIVLLPYLVRRAGVAPLLKAVEYYVAAAIGLAYVAIVPHAFPDYVANVLPIGLDLYAPIREPIAALLAAPGPLFAFVLAVCALRLARDDPGEPLVAIPALAGLGAFAAYLVQGKGWLYQAYPALAFFALAAGAALARAPQPRPRMALGAARVSASPRSALLALGRWPLPLAFVAAGVGAALAWVVEGRKRRRADRRNGRRRRARRGLRPVRHGRHRDAGDRPCARFARTASDGGVALGKSRLRPPDGAPGRRRLGRKASPACGLPPRPAGASTKTRATPRSPRACKSISTPTATGWSPTSRAIAPTRCWSAGSTPASISGCGAIRDIAAARADYRLFATEADTGFPAELWVRADLFGLRPSLPDGAAGKP